MKKSGLHILSAILLIVFTLPGRAQWSDEAVKIAQVVERINRFYVDTIDHSEVVEEAIVHMLHELDPHSSYLSKEDMELMSEQLEGEFEGIGVSFNVLEDTIYIIRAISGGPSEKVGIMAGDRIVAVEGENVAGTGITTRKVQSLLKGPKGSIVNISVKRRASVELIDFSITRDKIPVYSLDASYMVNESIGYVRLARFSNTTIDEFEKAVKDLKKQGMESLILDLTGNGGGWLPVAVELSDHFLSGNKEIVSTRGSKVRDNVYNAKSSGLFEKGQLVIMINAASASASEIVSGAVQDWDRGMIVGRRSFGKGLVQQPFPLGDGSMIRLTVARYYTPTGRLIQKPYEDGYEEYSMDLINRYNSGEISSSDSIEFPESQRFKTLVEGRTVYGGGGIMPDYFVPMDTSFYTPYYRKLFNLGIFNRYVLQYTDENRDKLTARYGNFDTFKRSYETSDGILKKLVDFAVEEGLEYNEEEWLVSLEQIKNIFKGYMARDLWSTGAMFEIFNEKDEIFLKSVDLLQNLN